jgi:hypothetical protein
MWGRPLANRRSVGRRTGVVGMKAPEPMDRPGALPTRRALIAGPVAGWIFG